jgi:FKBP-type peptidyl-prolyl cis-trans isomerase (trigger factor)
MPGPAPAAPDAGATFALRELPGSAVLRRFRVTVPAAVVAARHATRLAAIGRAGVAAADDPLDSRIRASALEEACRGIAGSAARALTARLGLTPAGAPRVAIEAQPPAADLVLLVEMPVFPAVTAPDPASLAIEALVARPEPAEEERAVAALAVRAATWHPAPPDAEAGPDDRVVCDLAVSLLPAPNRIPQPGMAGAAPGAPGSLPEGWAFGDNGAGLALEILKVEPAAEPPFIRLRVHGTAPEDGQSYLLFHPPGTVAAQPDSAWVGSVAIRPIGQPHGLRGGKLRLEGQDRSASGRLRRKDSALAGTPPQGGFARCYVSDEFPDPGTAFLRLVLLFDHAAGPVDFRCDVAAPRLVEGLDLGDQAEAPLPALSGAEVQLGAEAPDPVGLARYLPGIVAGEAREVVLPLPAALGDRALIGRSGRFRVRARGVLRRAVPPADDALARALGFSDIAALRGFVAERVAQRHAALARRQLRRAARDALLGAAGEIPLPEAAVGAEFELLWPRRAAAGATRAAVLEEAARRLRAGLVMGAVARAHGLIGDRESLDGTALEDRVLRLLLRRARITQRAVPVAELEAAAR